MTTLLLQRGKEIYYIGIHKQIFEIKNFYPLDIFDSFVTQIETTSENCYLESSCKIERDKLYPARFGIGFTLKNLKQLNNKPDYSYLNKMFFKQKLFIYISI